MPLELEESPCVERLDHQRITVNEKGKQVTFLNPARLQFLRVRVDGCLINNGLRADWIVSQDGVGSAIIELKGRNVEHAVDQVFATAENPNCVGWIVKPTRLLIVCAKYPAFDTKIAKAQLRAKKLGMSLKVVCRSFECKLEQI